MSDTTDVDEILKQRGAIYGTYRDGVSCRAAILSELESIYKSTHNNNDMPKDLAIMYGDFALKLMRSASDPTHLDSWVDLSGYAKLIKEVMCNED